MADDKDIAEDAPQGGGKKKLIIIVAAVVVLLLIGGAAAFFLLGGEDEEQAAAGEEATEVASDEPAEGAEPIYHELSPTFVVNLAPGGSVSMLQVAIQVLTYAPEVAETLTSNDPMIRHHVVNLLEKQQSETLLTVEGKTALQGEILDLLNERLEQFKTPGKVKDVYFTQFVMQ